jgi:hypothetical protein
MVFIGSAGRPVVVLLAAVAGSLVFATAALAYSQEQQQACTPDAFRLCSSDIPDVDRVTVCMIRNKSQLSPQCRAHFRPEPEAMPVAARPMNIRPARTQGRAAVRGVSAKPVSARPVGLKTRKPANPVRRANT